MTIPVEKSAPLTPTQLQGNTSFATSVALLLLRLVLGWIFIYAGSGKAFGAFGGIGIENTAKFIGSTMPSFLPPMAWAVLLAYTEFLGGMLILIGLVTRVASIPIIITMIVAIAKSTGKLGFMAQGGYAFNLALIAMAAALLLTGPGLISLDALFFRRSFLARGPQPLTNPVARP
jgi:putative oxidoreductase